MLNDKKLDPHFSIQLFPPTQNQALTFLSVCKQVHTNFQGHL